MRPCRAGGTSRLNSMSAVCTRAVCIYTYNEPSVCAYLVSRLDNQQRIVRTNSEICLNLGVTKKSKQRRKKHLTIACFKVICSMRTRSSAVRGLSCQSLSFKNKNDFFCTLLKFCVFLQGKREYTWFCYLRIICYLLTGICIK